MKMVHVIIPTPEQVKQMQLAGAYSHFNQRLLERYNIHITLKEYVSLCKSHLQTIKREQHKLIGIIKIKNVEVLVVRQRHKNKKLITALPYHNMNNYKNNMELTTKGGKPVRHLKLQKKNGKNIIVGELKANNSKWSSKYAEWKLDGTWVGGSGALDLKSDDIPEGFPVRMSPRITVRNPNQKNSVEELN